MQGLYIYEGVSIALANAFRKKGAPPEKYPDKPHRITPLTEEEKEDEKKKMVENFRAQLMALDKKFTEKHQREQMGR